MKVFCTGGLVSNKLMLDNLIGNSAHAGFFNGKLSKAAEANLPLVDEALTAMGNVAKTSPEIAAELGISIPKANAVLKLGVALSKMTVEDVKVPGKGTIKAYSAVVADEAEAEADADAE